MRDWRAALCGVAALVTTIDSLHGGELVQYFPAQAPLREARTGWRIRWAYTNPDNTPGLTSTPYIQSAEFMRAKEKEGTNQWVRVLHDARLAEIYVPYDFGFTIFDINGSNYPLVRASASFLWPSCVIPGRVLDSHLHAEVHDDDVRWMSVANEVRRGQELALWSALDAGNYRYLIQFAFRDDGVVAMRLGATAQNLLNSQADQSDIHVHAACWRFEMDLGAPDQIAVKQVARVPNVGTGGATLQAVDFNGNVEGGLAWDPASFTGLRIVSLAHFNDHLPPRNIAYDLISARAGSVRSGAPSETFANQDFWVTVSKSVPEMNYLLLPSYTDGESLAGQRLVLWHATSTWHVPRDEDFNRIGLANGGVALTMWSGFMLKPRNLWGATPSYP